MAGWRTLFAGLHRNRAAKRSRTYLYRLIWLMCVSACVPVVLVSTVYHYISVERMEKEILARSDASLVLLKDRAERVLQGIEQESLQLAQDPQLQRLIAKPENDSAILLHLDILEKIALVKNLSGFISEVAFAVATESVVLSNEYGVIPKDDYRYGEDLEAILRTDVRAQWVQLPQASKDGYITFARQLPVLGADGPRAVLAFEIDAASFSRFLETDTVLLPRDEQLMMINYLELFGSSSSDADELSERVTKLESIEAILASDANAGRFAGVGIDGQPAQFHFVKNLYSRTYVSVVPEAAITSQLGWIRGLTGLILLTFVGIGVLLTLYTSKRAYVPIENLIEHSRSLNLDRIQEKGNELEFIKACLDALSNEKTKLSSFMKDIEPSLREKSLQQLLGGEYSRHESLLEDCRKFGIDSRSTNVVLTVEAEHLFRVKRFLPEDRGVVAFALANVMQEILRSQPGLRGYVVPFQGRGIAILQFSPETNQPSMHQRTRDYARRVVEALKSFLQFDVVVGVGRYYAHIADVPVSFKESEMALKYRIFRDADPILYIEDVEQAKKQAVLRYPKALETDIVDALERGNAALAADSLRAFADTLRGSQSYVFIQQSYHILLSALIVSLDRRSVNLVDVVDSDLFSQLKEKTTFAEICGWFEETVFPLYLWLVRSEQEGETESGIPFICKYIREHCGDDLSLVQCAELAGVSPSYLSRLFKKEMGMNFLDYVVECKVAEAKRLLRETDRSVSDIASAVGYSERNLNRIFRRHVNMSPGTYRAKHQ